MYSAADLIDAVQRKLRVTARRGHPPGEFPPGWIAWFASMSERVGAVTGATADAIVAVFLQRPLTLPPRRLAAMTRWQAFSAVWRQQWHEEPGREQRGLRWTAVALTALTHVLLGGALLWLLNGPALVSPPPKGQTVVQVEYIGTGTPEEIGGGPQPQTEVPVEAAAAVEQATEAMPPTESAEPPATSQQAMADAVAMPQENPVLDAPVPEVVPRDVPTPPTPTPPVEQPLAVSEPVPDTTEVFLLPAPTRRISEPLVAVPELSAPVPAVRSRDVPEPFQPPSAPPRAVLQQPDMPALRLPQRVPDVAVRDVPAPLSRAIARELPTQPLEIPELRSTVPQVRAATIPMPSPAQPAPSASAPAPSAPPSARPAATAATPADAAPRATATPAGSGPRPTPTPGGWATPARADDWGDAARNQPGAQRGEQPGIYNSDGSVRLAETPGSASPAMPPGTPTEEIADLDRSGTWLKRPPTNYEPTTFDRYWRPSESLLAEWVRRGIKEVAIPIPGSSKRIVCVVSLLQAAGGCGISDPNLNDQPATARPPPDIPFKPDLQEDNGSVRPGG